MLFSLANLLASGVADKKGALSCLFIDDDGSTFSTDRMSLVVVEPSSADPKDFRAAGVEPCDVRKGGVSIPVDTIKEILKDVPKQPGRNVHKNAAMTKCGNTVEFATTNDGISVKKNSVTRARTTLPDIRGFMQAVKDNDKKVCVSLKRLKNIVDTFDKMCGGDDSQPVFLEIGGEDDPICLRTQSYMTGQRILGVVTTVEVESWLKLNKWERDLLNRGAIVKKKKVARREGKHIAKRRHFDVEL